MDVSLARYKPRRLKTEGIPLAIALNPGGDHLAVGCSNGDICFWRLPLDDDAAPAHKVCICEWSGVEVSSVLWLSDRLVAVGRRNGLIAVVKLDYSHESLSVVNLQADDRNQAVRCISYHSKLKRVATATTGDITTWELDQQQWHLWKKSRTFAAYTGPALSKEEENLVEITSVHWLKRHKGLKEVLLVSFLHHGVRIIDVDSQQVVHNFPVRTHVGSLSISADEKMITINNVHNGFNLYSLPHGTALEHLVEPGLPGGLRAVFMWSDLFLVYPGNDGALKVWDMKLGTSTGSVHDVQPSQVLAVEGCACKSYNGHSVLVTLARSNSPPNPEYITVWESLRRDEFLAQQVQFNFSVTASLVVIAAVAATWYLASRGSNIA